MTRATFRGGVYLVLTRGTDILLLRRFNTGYEDGQYSLPCGHIEPGESTTAAMLREAAEEVGLHLVEGDLEFALVLHRRDPADAVVCFDHFFVADGIHLHPRNLEPGKCDELRWASMDDLPNEVIPYIAYALGQIRAGVYEAEFGW